MPALYVLILSILLSACATTPPVDKKKPLPTDSLSESASQVNNPEPKTGSCLYILRNLSIAWPLRNYWCGSSVSDGESVIDGGSASLALDKIKRRVSLFQGVVVRAKHLDVVATTTATANQNPLRPAQEALPVQGALEVPLTFEENGDEVHKIWFAAGRETLGPQGRKQARDLIGQVRGARYVTVRGLLVNGEFGNLTELAAERRSVGRSLSVRELWQLAGVDAHVTILHHTQLRDGRYVEVNIHD